MNRIEALRQREERWRETEYELARNAIANVGDTGDYFAAYTANGDVGIFADRHGREIVVWRREVTNDDQGRWLRFAQAEAERLNAEHEGTKEVSK